MRRPTSFKWMMRRLSATKSLAQMLFFGGGSQETPSSLNTSLTSSGSFCRRHRFCSRLCLTSDNPSPDGAGARVSSLASDNPSRWELAAEADVATGADGADVETGARVSSLAATATTRDAAACASGCSGHRGGGGGSACASDFRPSNHSFPMHFADASSPRSTGAAPPPSSSCRPTVDVHAKNQVRPRGRGSVGWGVAGTVVTPMRAF